MRLLPADSDDFNRALDEMPLLEADVVPALVLDAHICPNPYSFICNHCICLINTECSIYMRNDFTYCSTGCRDRGISAKYRNLILNNPSVPASRLATNVENSLLGAGKDFFNSVLRKVGSSLWGDRVLRSYSYSLDWSKAMTRNSSLHFMLAYFPDLDHDNPSPSGMPLSRFPRRQSSSQIGGPP